MNLDHYTAFSTIPFSMIYKLIIRLKDGLKVKNVYEYFLLVLLEKNDILNI